MVMVSMTSTVFVWDVFSFGAGFGFGFGFGVGLATILGAGEQIDSTHRSAASAERGMLAIWDALGQLTFATTGLVG